MAALRAVLAVAVLLALSGCGDTASDGSGIGDDAGATPHEAPAAFAGAPHGSVSELFTAVDAAIGAETSVHQENGNLNPPPPAILDQEYGAAGSDLHHYVDLGPTAEDLAEMSADEAAEYASAGLVFLVYRVDGVLYAEDAPPLPLEEAEDKVGGALLATLQSDVRTDFRRLADVASDLTYVGEENVGGFVTRHYRFTVDLDPGQQVNPAIVPSAVAGSKPVELWVGTDDLPVRIDIAYGKVLGDIPGTGVSRTDYSRWSAPIELDADNLDWDRPEPASVRSQ